MIKTFLIGVRELIQILLFTISILGILALSYLIVLGALYAPFLAFEPNTSATLYKVWATLSWVTIIFTLEKISE